jgi:hypothetical protein
MLGWFGRLKDSVGGVLVGIVLGLFSIFVLWTNEGRAVDRARSLAEGRKIVEAAEATKVDASQDGKLVHVTGDAKVQGEVVDGQFAVRRPVVRLRREVEMFQWHERKRSGKKRGKSGGRKDPRDYTYEKRWDDDVEDSDRFADPSGHRNPPRMPYEGKTYSASAVSLGARQLGALVKKMSSFEPSPLEQRDVDAFPPDVRGRGRLQAGVLYVGAGQAPADPANPQIGDVRISFEVVRPGPVSVIAGQASSGFQPFKTSAGGELYELHTGIHSAEEMFSREESANTVMTWGLRFLGFMLMFGAFSLVTRPLVVLFEWIPLLGGLIGAGVGFFAFLAAAFCSLVIIAIAWFAVRPMLSIGLLVLGVLLVVGGRAALGGVEAKPTPFPGGRAESRPPDRNPSGPGRSARPRETCPVARHAWRAPLAQPGTAAPVASR